MSWGAKLVGFTQLEDAFEGLQTQIEGNAIYFVGSNVEYSIYVELGTSKMEAQPYLRRALQAVERSIDRIIDRKDPDTTDELVKIVALEVEALAARFAPVQTGNLQASISTERAQ